MRYLLATCPETDPGPVLLLSESTDLPGLGPGRSVEFPCWAGCGNDTTHPLTELDAVSAVAFLRTEADRAEIAQNAPGDAGTPGTGRQTPQDGSQPDLGAVPSGSSPPHDGPGDAPRISNNRRISNHSTVK